jgi:hypothetical protein
VHDYHEYIFQHVRTVLCTFLFFFCTVHIGIQVGLVVQFIAILPMPVPQ